MRLARPMTDCEWWGRMVGLLAINAAWPGRRLSIRTNRRLWPHATVPHVVDGGSMEILMVTAELAPYARASEAADSVAALSKSLRQLGHEVTVAMPRYPSLEQGGLQLARRLSPLPLRGGEDAIVFDGQLPSGVKLVVFDAPVLYDRVGVYVGQDGKPFVDNGKRFGFLAQAAAALVRQRVEQGHSFDILHLHDWPAALVPLLARLEPGPDLPALLTIHDGADCGRFSTRELGAFGLTKELAHDEGLSERSKFNVLRAGLSHAAVITTASPTYAAELIDDQKFGEFAGIVASVGKPIVGILNGVDYSTCNPATDPLLECRYDAEEAGGKLRSKTALLRSLGMELDVERPVVAILGALGRDSCSDLVASSLTGLMKLDVSLVVAGVAPSAMLTQRSLSVAKRFPKRFRSEDSPSDTFLHRLLAGADLAIVPARHVPSGLTTMTAQRYGAVPIALATGAHCDCVVDVDAALNTGTGYLFDDAHHGALVGAAQRAVAGYASPSFAQLRRRVMRLDLGWDRAARRYVQLYKQAVGART